MSLARALVWNTGIQVIGKVLSTVLGVFVIAFMTRLLKDEGFGMYSTANAFITIFALVLDLGLNVTFIALLGEHAGDKVYEKRCISALFTLRIVSSIVVIGLMAPLIGWFTSYPLPIKFAIIGLLGSFIFPAINQVVIGVQQRHLSMHWNAISEIAGRIVLFTGLFFALRLQWDLLTVCLFISAGSFTQFILNIISAYKFGGFTWNWDPAFWKQALSRSWPIGVSIIFNLIYFKADTLVLGWFRPQAEVGIYSAAYRILELLITVPFMYAGIMLPVLSMQWASNKKDQFSSLLSYSLDAMILITAPLLAGTFVLGPRLLTLVAGDSFALSGQIIRILVIAVGAIYLNTVISHAIVALNTQRKMLPFYVGVAVIALAGYIIFIPTHGMWAAAWLTVFSEVAILFCSWFVLSRSTKAWPHRSSLIASSVAATIMALVLLRLDHLPLAALVVTGIAIYGSVAYALGGIPKQLVNDLLSFRRST